MIYANTWNLTGTERQQAIVKDALDAIKFPWERIKLPRNPTEIGWRNLNDGTYNQAPNPAVDQALKVRKHEGHDPAPRKHGDEDHSKPKDPAAHPDVEIEPLYGAVDGEGRKYIMGIFYPGSGRIYIDNALVNYPAHARATVSAEIAHAVDEFLPLSDAQRTKIIELLHPDGPDQHTWWEKVSYGDEYYTLVGESFMILFTYAYSDIEFEGADDFIHPGDRSMAEAVRKIIGIDRTDKKSETTSTTSTTKVPDTTTTTSTSTSSTTSTTTLEPSTTTTTTEEPTTTTTTTEVPSTTTTTTAQTSDPLHLHYFAKATGKVYHDSHKNVHKQLEGEMVEFHSKQEAENAGYRPCKICKP